VSSYKIFLEREDRVETRYVECNCQIIAPFGTPCGTRTMNQNVCENMEQKEEGYIVVFTDLPVKSFPLVGKHTRE